MVDILTGLGYRVLKAGDAQSALTLLETGVEVDLLFTDVVMPGPLRSPELARRARLLLPDIEVLFTSGYTENAIVHGGRLDAGVALISKPYRQEELAGKIRHMINNRDQVLQLRAELQKTAQLSRGLPAGGE
ncbi:response regulator [Xylophilus rhododendri]|uniref:Response regulator n=1 Tax=Xylophilus rhododendri TaxID=2697032 RepID=A0A857JCR0_9BURK|nr:response regulator [Xylophilus rhododendri]